MCTTDHYELVLEGMVAEATVGASVDQPGLVDGRLEGLDRIPHRVFDDHPPTADPFEDLVAEARLRTA